MIKILRITKDEKFFDLSLPKWEKLPNVDVSYAIVSRNKKSFNFIKNIDKIILFSSITEVISFIKNNNIQIVYFDSLSITDYRLVIKLPVDVKVIWWAWGYDLYFRNMGLPPLIPLNLYKAETLKYIKSVRDKGNFVKAFLKLILRPYLKYIQRQALKRIDYIKTVLPIEYDILLQSNCYKFKPFDLDYSSILELERLSDLISSNIRNKILIGNSSSPSGNHIDILSMISKYKITSDVVMPLSYGDHAYKEFILSNPITKSICKLKTLEEFIPLSEYESLIGSCGFAIFGNIRQEAIGNITKSLARGVKVFLWKDSISYKQFVKDGFFIYTIDHDLNEEALKVPLSYEAALHNISLINKFKTEENYYNYIFSEFNKVILDK